MRGPGRLLALETSGPVGSVAVAVEGRVVARRFLSEPRTHAAGVVPAVAGVLAEAGLAAGALEGVVVGAGPGSFTGVRVAAATGKGLVHALGVPLWAVSSLASAALSARVLPPGAGPWEDGMKAGSPPPDAVTVLFDARGRRLFMAAFQELSGDLQLVRAPCFTTVDELLADTDGGLSALPLAGDGAVRHQDEFRRAGRTVLPAPHGVPTADSLAALVQTGRMDPLRDPAGWEPEYLRATGAERHRRSERSPTMG